MQTIEDICKDYVSDVYRYLFCITHNTEIAEKLTQETMYKAIRNINQFNGECKINLWLYKIAKVEWYKYINNKNKPQKKLKNITLTSNATTEDKVIANTQKEKIYRAIQKLDDETSQVMFLKLENNMDFKEIGKIFDKTQRWAIMKFFRGKEIIKEMLRNEESEQTM